MRLGVPLIPDRAAVRSTTTRRPIRAIGTHSLPLVVAAAIGIVALVVGVGTGTVPAAGAIGVAVLIPAAVIDVEQRRLPDAWIAAAMVGLVATIAIGAAVAGGMNGTTIELVDLVGAAAAMTLPVLALHLMSPTSMGFGDVKASVVLGAAVGTIDWRLGAIALCLAAAIGAATGLATRRRTIPFGPCLVVGAWLVLLAHEPILDAVFTAGGHE